MAHRDRRSSLRSILRIVAVMAATVSGAHAQMARIEIYPIATVDLTTAQVLQGGTPAAPLPARTIAGELRLPVTTAARVPAVVFLHGDAGAISDQPPWIDELNAAGYAVFTIDSFSARGAVSTSAQLGGMDGAPGAATRIADAYRALAILVAHPRIDPARIALMGVSSGGRTTVLSAMKRFSGPLATSDARFAAYVALYPPCNARLVDDERLERGPLRIFSGGADNITRADACVRFAARLRAAGADAETIVFPGAYHGFDNPPGAPGVDLPEEPSFSACSLIERDGRLVNVDTGQPAQLADRCVGRGFKAGRDATADRAVRAAVPAFLAKAFAAGR